MLFAIIGLGPMEMMIIGVIAVLLFGSRLPSVMRNLGKGFVEFKQGMQGIESDMNSALDTSTSHATYEDDLDRHSEPVAPKFEPPTSEPSAEDLAETDEADPHDVAHQPIDDSAEQMKTS